MLSVSPEGSKQPGMLLHVVATSPKMTSLSAWLIQNICPRVLQSACGDQLGANFYGKKS